MNKSRIRLILAAALLVISLMALAWGLLPGERTVLHQRIQPTEMQLPTPQGYLPQAEAVASVIFPQPAVRVLQGADRFDFPI